MRFIARENIPPPSRRLRSGQRPINFIIMLGLSLRRFGAGSGVINEKTRVFSFYRFMPSAEAPALAKAAPRVAAGISDSPGDYSRKSRSTWAPKVLAASRTSRRASTSSRALNVPAVYGFCQAMPPSGRGLYR